MGQEETGRHGSRLEPAAGGLTDQTHQADKVTERWTSRLAKGKNRQQRSQS